MTLTGWNPKVRKPVIILICFGALLGFAGYVALEYRIHMRIPDTWLLISGFAAVLASNIIMIRNASTLYRFCRDHPNQSAVWQAIVAGFTATVVVLAASISPDPPVFLREPISTLSVAITTGGLLALAAYFSSWITGGVRQLTNRRAREHE
jgi:glucose uptake protein GlcU